MDRPSNKAILLSEKDNVATLLTDISKEQAVDILDDSGEIQATVCSRQAITFGNKIAVQTIPHNALIYKAGYAVGIAVKAIPKGELVHVQNVRSTRIDIPETIINSIIEQMQIEE
ncbi:UxaA family hydrolase [Psychromonas aquimarina]|uniref:UxaA family hydrolase n=1 Tax=Psychromonas aquimarina TaxID=444919 RepID=UPI00040BA1ED|nr:UxaA family hydrolase [Psychromonas aquimarina]